MCNVHVHSICAGTNVSSSKWMYTLCLFAVLPHCNLYRGAIAHKTPVNNLEEQLFIPFVRVESNDNLEILDSDSDYMF